MNATQPELGFHDVAPDSPDAQWLARWLEEHPGWHLATDILRTLGRDEESEDEKRAIRAAASARVEVLSGQKGYCHIKHAVDAEFQHTVSGWESQARKLNDRAIRARQYRHAQIG